MATITASLERSLQNCSLNQTTGVGGGRSRSRSSNSSDYHQTSVGNHNLPHHQHHNQETVTTASNASSSYQNGNSDSTFVELNSHVSLPYHWEQCLDLKTGEIYYINWSNGMKVREDPRTTTAGYNGDYDCDSEDEDEDEDEEEEEEEDDDDDDEVNNNVAYESEGSSAESYRSSSTRATLRSSLKKLVMGGSGRRHGHQEISQDSVLVVAGCKSCLMYHMVPKHQEICPKCSGQLLHFPPNPTS